MKINDIVFINQIEEASVLGLGQRIGQVGGGAVKGAKDFVQGIKQGYKIGRTGQSTTSTQTASTPTATIPNTQQTATQSTQQTSPQSTQQQAPTTVMKASEIVKDLSDVWTKATADQGSQTTSPAVQNQIRTMAKQAGLAGQTIRENNIEFQSKFLGIKL